MIERKQICVIYFWRRSQYLYKSSELIAETCLRNGPLAARGINIRIHGIHGLASSSPANLAPQAQLCSLEMTRSLLEDRNALEHGGRGWTCGRCGKAWRGRGEAVKSLATSLWLQRALVFGPGHCSSVMIVEQGAPGGC